MTDSRLRSHARAAASSGDPQDEARLLVERLRVAPRCGPCEGTGYLRRCGGGLFASPSSAQRAAGDAVTGACSACCGTGSPLKARVKLAAYCGSEAARLAHGDSIYGAAAEAGTVDFEAWLRGLDRHGFEAELAAATSAADLALPVCLTKRGTRV